MSAVGFIFIIVGLVGAMAGSQELSLVSLVGLPILLAGLPWPKVTARPVDPFGDAEGEIVHRHEHHEHIHHHHHHHQEPSVRAIEIARELPDGSKIALRQVRRWH